MKPRLSSLATDNGRLEGENLTKSGAIIDFVKLDGETLDRVSNADKIAKFINTDDYEVNKAKR